MQSEWNEVQLGDVAQIRRGSSPRPIIDFMTNDGMPWVKIADATENDSRFINSTKEFIKKEGVPRSVIVEKGDLILSNSGTAGLPKFMGLTACVHDGWQVFKELDGIDKEFLYYTLINIRSKLLFNAYDSTMKNLTLDMVREAKINLPPLPTQKKIAHILSTLDDRIELNRKMNQTLEEMAQALFKSWFVDFDPVHLKVNAAGREDTLGCKARCESEEELEAGAKELGLSKEVLELFPSEFVESEMGMIPLGWSHDVLGSFVEILDSKRIPLAKNERAKRQGSIPYYGATSVMDYVDDYLFDEPLTLLGEDGSVVRDDGTPFMQYIWGKAWVNNHAHVIKSKSALSTEAIYVALLKQNVTMFVTGAVQPKINQTNLKRIPMVNPGDKLHRVYSDSIAPMFAKIRQLSDETETLVKTRDTLLPKLLSGELDVSKLKITEEN